MPRSVGVGSSSGLGLSAVPSTISSMSSSLPGRETLAQRSARAGVGVGAPRAELPCHVWVLNSSSWLPGVLVEWVRLEDGSWGGSVMMVTTEGPGEWIVPSPFLRPANSTTPQLPFGPAPV